MRVVHVSYFYDKKLTSEEELLEKHYTITGLAEALQRKGAEVIVINRFSKEGVLQKNNVQYYFIKDGLPANLRSRHLPLKLFRKIAELNADVIHLHHLSLCIQTLMLRRMLKRKTAIVIQHHGGPPPPGNRKFFYNLFNSVADGYFFTSSEQGKEWCKKNQLAKVMPVMEGATFFDYYNRDINKPPVYQSRIEARKMTGMAGSPVFLWAGNLIARKDPITVLAGFEKLLTEYPDARLYMIFVTDTLLEKVNDKIMNSDKLKQSVCLIGKVRHEKMIDYYNSADYFVSGSYSEGSGYALSEALRCGCIPIVTTIPSFRMMTNNGQLGALWEPGNKDSFVKAAIKAINKSLADEAKVCIDFFKANLSFDAIAEIAIKHYQRVIESRRRK